MWFGIGIVIGSAISVIAWQVAAWLRASWRRRVLDEQLAEDTERFIAWVRADQRRTRAATDALRRTAEAYRVHLPTDDETNGA